MSTQTTAASSQYLSFMVAGEEYALGIWQSGSNDDVWDACFRWDPNAPELVYSDPQYYPPGATPGRGSASSPVNRLAPRASTTGSPVPRRTSSLPTTSPGRSAASNRAARSGG